MVVKQLLERNSVDPDLKDNDNLTPLSSTTEEGPKTKRQVLQKPVDPNSKDRNDRMSLSLAAEEE